MRVVCTVERYFPAIGGAERVVQRVAEGLAARGHEVVVVSSGSRSTEQRNGVRIERFAVRGNAARGIRGDVRPALDLIERASPEVVLNYAAQTWTTDACSSFLRRKRDFRLVLAPCGFSALRDPGYRGYFEGIRRDLPLYDALIFHSSIYRDWAFAAEVGAEQRIVIPNGADDPMPETHSGDDVLVVTIGSHVRSKGHSDFARAIRALGPTVRGAIVAPPRLGLDRLRGCQAACLVRTAASRGRLELIDGRDPAAAPRALAAAHLFLFPSRIECAPLVVLESMAAGVPWVSYDVGNVRELRGGVVVDDFDRLVAAARTLLKSDSGRGEEGRTAWSERHRWEDVVGQYESAFSELVSARGRVSSRA